MQKEKVEVLEEFVKMQGLDFKRLRLEAGLTRLKAGQLLGVSDQAVWYIEDGTNFSVETRLKMMLLYSKIIEKSKQANQQ